MVGASEFLADLISRAQGGNVLGLKSKLSVLVKTLSQELWLTPCNPTKQVENHCLKSEEASLGYKAGPCLNTTNPSQTKGLTLANP